MKDQVDLDYPRRSDNIGTGPKFSKDREFGKDIRHLLKLVCFAFLNPSEQNSILYKLYFLIFDRIYPMGYRRILSTTCERGARQKTSKIPQPFFGYIFGTYDGSLCERSHCIMVSSGVTLRQTTGRLFLNLSIVNVTDLL